MVNECESPFCLAYVEKCIMFLCRGALSLPARPPSVSLLAFSIYLLTTSPQIFCYAALLPAFGPPRPVSLIGFTEARASAASSVDFPVVRAPRADVSYVRSRACLVGLVPGLGDQCWRFSSRSLSAHAFSFRRGISLDGPRRTQATVVVTDTTYACLHFEKFQ